MTGVPAVYRGRWRLRYIEGFTLTSITCLSIPVALHHAAPPSLPLPAGDEAGEGQQHQLKSP
ncbi:hypothetical protein E2C01_022932 [Portunus trituberculatus]|uniref:Uncharacterized protein n=1 Tax=Portunus trituberculatus TaxID=210409 RepID=A0A5B7E8Z2_PORTR|nr:hypothetical protein [Portunus trituberculatus]